MSDSFRQKLWSAEESQRQQLLAQWVDDQTAEHLDLLHEALLAEEFGEQPRYQVAEAIGQLHSSPEALKLLLQLSHHDEPFVRGAAALGMGHSQSAATINRLIDLLSDKVNTVRNLAERALIHQPAALKAHGQQKLLELLDHPVPLTRSPAARLAGHSQMTAALDRLLEILTTDKQWLARMWAAKALGDMGEQSACAALEQSLKSDEKNRVRAAAAEAIGQLRPPNAELLLREALNDDDGGVRKLASEALASLGLEGLGADEYEME